MTAQVRCIRCGEVLQPAHAVAHRCPPPQTEVLYSGTGGITVVYQGFKNFWWSCTGGGQGGQTA